MNPMAKRLNETIETSAPHVYAMLSDLGRRIYFPKEGIISQSAEAGKKAHKFNATIGIATENGRPMHLKAIQDQLSAFDPKELYPYAPPAGKPALRDAWQQRQREESPSLINKKTSKPIATNALTHGLSIVADLFADRGDAVIIPDKNWENYELTFGVRREAVMVEYPLYDEEMRFNAEGLKQAILAQKERGKAIVILNFPNNPTGYTPTEDDGKRIVQALQECAEAGVNIVAVTDDAYYGLFFENSMKESLFAQICGINERILAIKVDGATKEDYVWGFRVGFITYGYDHDEVLEALEQKTIGIIRATISSGPHPSQSAILKAMQSEDYEQQKQEKYNIMKSRANLVKRLLDSGRYDDAWDYYPFNSGYFMCLKLKTVDAETLRTHLLDNYGVGTIALGKTDLRVAFSCIDEPDLEELYDTIYKGVKEVEQLSQQNG
jgi:aspartate/methionine/tyrosine aminotransferase